MALVNWWVNPDESGLADGTSRTDAYPEQVVFQAGEFTDLVSATDNWVLHCFSSAGTADLTFVNYTGWTMSASFDLVILVDEGDWGETGIYDDTAYRMEVTNNNCISISSGADFITIDHLQFGLTSTSNSRRAVFLNPDDGGVMTVTNNVFSADISSTPTNDNAGIWMNFAGSGNRTLNLGGNIIYDFINGSENVMGTMQNSGWTSYQYRNTVVDCYNGIRRNGGTAIAKANIVKGANTSFMGSFDSASDYNSTDTGTATGGTNDRVSQTFTFEDEVNDDFHLGTTDTGAKGFGLDLSGDANFIITVDIDNDIISSPYDIGADQIAGGVLYEMSATGEIGVEGSSYIVNIMNLTGEGEVGIEGIADIVNLINLTGEGEVGVEGIADIISLISLTGEGEVGIEGSANLTFVNVIYDMSATGEVGIEGSANTVSLKSLGATGEVGVEGFANIISLLGLGATGEVAIEGSGRLIGVFGLSSNGEIGIEGQALLNTLQTLIATGEVAIEGLANLTFVGVDDFDNVSFFTVIKKGDSIDLQSKKIDFLPQVTREGI